MPSNAPPANRRDLRSAIGLTYANALAWALGNGLVSTTLVVYLALNLNASGVTIAWLVAAPRFAGILRLGAPRLISAAHSRGIGRKGVCLLGYAASAFSLALVPFAPFTANDSGLSHGTAIGVLVGSWCLYHLLEYIATVALWSWIGDLYPSRLRSRLLGVRERWLTLGRLVGVGASILLALAWKSLIASGPNWAPFAASAAVGALLMLAALLPLLRVPSLANRLSARPASTWNTIKQALSNRAYSRLLTYSCWLGFANGLAASAMSMYPWRVLRIDYSTIQCYRAVMWAGQSAAAPWCGRALQAWGAKRLMFPAQLIVAAGPVCYLLASEEQPWWIGVAFVAWIAYAALNVSLDTLKLDLAAPDNNAPYLAVFHSLSDLANGVTILAGGLLYDLLSVGDELALHVYAGLFFASWIARSLAAGLILRLEEPAKDSKGDKRPE